MQLSKPRPLSLSTRRTSRALAIALVALATGGTELCSQAATTATGLRLPALFTDSMVVQRGKPIPVWGWAKSGADVRVVFGRSVRETKADGTGKWRVDLPAIKKPGGPYTLHVHAGRKIAIRDVLVGDVWVCSGQSNMAWTVTQAAQPKAEIANAKFPKIRLFHVPRLARETPQTEIKAKWQRCAPDSVKRF